MKRIAIIASAALALAAGSAGSADAYNGWHWSSARARGYVISHMITSDDAEVVTARCKGYGPAMRSHGMRLYARFNCSETDEYDRYFEVRLRVTGKYTARAVELYCDDSDSDEYCP